MRNKLLIFFLFIIALCTAFRFQKTIANDSISKDDSELEDNTLIEIDNVAIKKASFVSEGNISQFKIDYPYLDDYSQEIITKINEQIFNAVITEDMLVYKGYDEDVDITYEITYANNDILSILFWGSKNISGAYADYKKGITIDLKNGEILSLEDFYTLSELQTIINNLIETEKCTVIIDEFNNTEQKMLVKLHCLELFEKQEGLYCTDRFYIKKNKICLIGDPYPSMRQYIPVEFEINQTPQVKKVKGNFNQ